MHPNTSFKDLKDKFRERYGDHTMALDESPYSRILDSDTLASLSASP